LGINKGTTPDGTLWAPWVFAETGENLDAKGRHAMTPPCAPVGVFTETGKNLPALRLTYMS
jgi:hypothetical protein